MEIFHSTRGDCRERDYGTQREMAVYRNDTIWTEMAVYIDDSTQRETEMTVHRDDSIQRQREALNEPIPPLEPRVRAEKADMGNPGLGHVPIPVEPVATRKKTCLPFPFFHLCSFKNGSIFMFLHFIKYVEVLHGPPPQRLLSFEAF